MVANVWRDAKKYKLPAKGHVLASQTDVNVQENADLFVGLMEKHIPTNVWQNAIIQKFNVVANVLVQSHADVPRNTNLSVVEMAKRTVISATPAAKM